LNAEVSGARLNALIGRARVFDLGQRYWWGMPVHPADPPFLQYLYRYHEHTQPLFAEIAPGFADSISLITTSMHAGTHLDVPIHMSRNLKVLGQDVTRYQTDKGYRNLPPELKSVDQVQPLVLRAVLLDVCAAKGVDLLPKRYGVTPEDLEVAENLAGTEVGPGDCALIRTGYSRFFEADPHAYLHDFAGLLADSAHWLAKRGVALVGIDNLAIGVPKPFECHNVLLTDHGIYVMKSLMLEDLAKDRIAVSTVIVSPLKIVGGEASLVRPIAIA
jgi:kynurenine formamidase